MYSRMYEKLDRHARSHCGSPGLAAGAGRTIYMRSRAYPEASGQHHVIMSSKDIQSIREVV